MTDNTGTLQLALIVTLNVAVMIAAAWFLHRHGFLTTPKIPR